MMSPSLRRRDVSGSPGAGRDPGAGVVEGHVRGVGGEARQDAVWIALREGVDLDRVVGAGRHQLALLLNQRDKTVSFICRGGLLR